MALRSQYKQSLGDWTLSAGVLAEQNNYSAQSFRVVDEVQFGTDLNFLRYDLSGQLSREWSAYGVEFTYQRKLRDRFYGLLAYTLYWSEFTGFDTKCYLPSRWDNRHLLTFTGVINYPETGR